MDRPTQQEAAFQQDNAIRDGAKAGLWKGAKIGAMIGLAVGATLVVGAALFSPTLGIAMLGVASVGLGEIVGGTLASGLVGAFHGGWIGALGGAIRGALSPKPKEAVNSNAIPVTDMPDAQTPAVHVGPAPQKSTSMAMSRDLETRKMTEELDALRAQPGDWQKTVTRGRPAGGVSIS